MPVWWSKCTLAICLLAQIRARPTTYLVETEDSFEIKDNGKSVDAAENLIRSELNKRDLQLYEKLPEEKKSDVLDQLDRMIEEEKKRIMMDMTTLKIVLRSRTMENL